MALITYPSGLKPRSESWTLMANQSRFESNFTGSVQIIARPGNRWRVSLDFGQLPEDKARQMIAFLTALNGQANTFDYSPHYAGRPLGVATGTPVVNGANQTGSTLTTTGWTPSVAGILRQGDFIAVNNELKMVTGDVNSNGSGAASVPIQPMLRSSPADGASITVSGATARMRAVDAGQAAATINLGNNASISFEAMEAF